MSEPKIIKTISPEHCPHCGKKIFIGSQSMPLNITSITTEEDIALVKNKIKERIKEIKFYNDNEKLKIESWLTQDTTFLDASDIEPLMTQIAREQVEIIAATQLRQPTENTEKE